MPWSTVLAAQPASASASFDPWVEVYTANLQWNVQAIARLVSGRPILAVIKNNGYGLGVANVARILEPLDRIAGFAVVKLHEAVSLRDSGVKKPILWMGPGDERDLEHAVRNRIQPMIYTPVGRALESLRRKTKAPIPIQICVDTGIGRVGVQHTQAAQLVRDLAGTGAVSIEGIMMTFAEDLEFDREQLKRFHSVCGDLQAAGVRIGRKHAASSYTLFQHSDAFLDMVRPGMAVYGVYPELEFRQSEKLDLRPAVSFKARVAYVKQLKRGETAGYSRAYVARDDVWIATLPVGHADGWPRMAAKGARVRIGGDLYPVIASVSASHTIVEIGAEPKVRIGDEVTMFDAQPGSRPEDVAAACGSSVYDLLMHLNPLLPRRVI